MGCKDAVFIFSKLLKPHTAFLISHGINVDLFIDDERIAASTLALCIAHTEIARKALRNAGWVENFKKYNPPTQQLEFLGLINDVKNLRYFVPLRKKDAIRELIKEALDKPSIHVKFLASILGKIQSCFLALGTMIRFCTRFSFKVLALAPSWNSWVILTPFSRWELLFISCNLDKFDGQSMISFAKVLPISKLLFASDSSSEGAFVYKFRISDCDQQISVDDSFIRKQFSLGESERSSTYRELIAFAELYSVHGHRFKGQSILHFTDSLNAKRILEFGSKRTHLHFLAFIIFSHCHKHQINLKVEWLSRNDPVIELADAGSKTWDSSDFRLDDQSFAFIQQSFGFFSIDLFANEANRRTPRFFSLHFSPLALGLNAFAHSWAREFAYIFPPPRCITACIQKIIQDQAQGVIIVPFWRASKFMLSISANGTHLNAMFPQFFRFRPIFSKSSDVISDTFSGPAKFDMLAIRFDGSISNPLSAFLPL